MTILYSPSSHATGLSSGFYLASDKKIPQDAFLVADSDHMLAINLPEGSKYDFTRPTETNKNGILVITDPTNDFLLQKEKLLQIGLLQQNYQEEMTGNIPYISIGKISASYQAGQKSIDNLQNLLVAFSSAPSSLPSDFYWVAADNTQVSFTYADMQKLGSLIALRGIAAFNNLQIKKSLINSATTISAIQSVVW